MIRRYANQLLLVSTPMNHQVELHLCRALKIEHHSTGRLGNSEGDSCLGRVGIDKSIPPSISCAEKGAADLIPVRLRVLDACDSLATLRSFPGLHMLLAYRTGHRNDCPYPSRLRHPNRFTSSNAFCLCQSILKALFRIGDGVGMCCLKVRESVVAQEISSTDGASVFAQNPCGPCVDMSNLLARENSAFERTADLADVADDLRGCRTNASIVCLTLRAATI